MEDVHRRAKLPFVFVSHKPCSLRPVFTFASAVLEVEFLNKESFSVADITADILSKPLSIL